MSAKLKPSLSLFYLLERFIGHLLLKMAYCESFFNSAIFYIFIEHVYLELVFAEHKRAVNRIQFHPFEKDLLLSGSQDGTMKFFVG